MKRSILTTAIIFLLSAAPAAADGPPDTLPPLPSETGEEICTGRLTTCTDGLTSCQEDRKTWQTIANECLGLPSDADLATAEKKRVEKPKPPTKRKRHVRKSAPPKPKPAPPKPVNGKDGADGVDGKDGHSIVWSVRRLKPGKTCANGGYLTMFGLDSNDDRKLDPTESADLMAVCHGKDGKDGVDGKDGRDGRDGDDGVRPEVGVGTVVNALFAHNRPNSYSAFAVASLGWPLNDSVSLTLTGGAAPGRDAAMMLGASLDWRMGSDSGLKTGLIYQVVGLTDNNYANDQYALLSVGVYKDLNLYKGDSVNLNLRGEVNGLVGVDGFINSDRKTRAAYGVGGGLGLRLEF